MLEALLALKEADSLFNISAKADFVKILYFDNAQSLNDSIQKAFNIVHDKATFYLSPRTKHSDIVSVMIVGPILRQAERPYKVLKL